MDLRSYLAALRKSWIIVAIAAVLGAGIGFYLYHSTPKMYQSTVTFYVATPQAASGTQALYAAQYAEDRANSYVAVLSSQRMAAMVQGQPGVDLPALSIAKKVTAAAQLNTVLVKVTVQDTSGPRSLAIAKAISTQFPVLVNQLDNDGANEKSVSINVISAPALNPQAVSPRKTIDVGIGLLLGLLIGLGIAILRELLDTTVRSVDDLTELADVPVLASIPYDPAARVSPLVVGAAAHSMRAESYRQLRTNMQFIGAAKSADVVVVTSSEPDEGKSTTAVNLAIVLTQIDQRVLLIEADLRRPRVSALLNVEGGAGLTNVLAGKTEVQAVIQRWGEDGLSVLPSGPIPPNPAELLGTQAMSDLIVAMRGKFDKIVIDAPPLLPVTDAVVLSAYADGAVVVVRHGRARRTAVAAAIKSLETIGSRVLGTVLNMQPIGRSKKHLYGGYTSARPAAELDPAAVSIGA